MHHANHKPPFLALPNFTSTCDMLCWMIRARIIQRPLTAIDCQTRDFSHRFLAACVYWNSWSKRERESSSSIYKKKINVNLFFWKLFFFLSSSSFSAKRTKSTSAICILVDPTIVDLDMYIDLIFQEIWRPSIDYLISISRCTLLSFPRRLELRLSCISFFFFAYNLFFVRTRAKSRKNRFSESENEMSSRTPRMLM